MTTPQPSWLAHSGTLHGSTLHSSGRPSGVTVWRRIADTLANDIRNRAFGPDGRLPSETELAARFGVNRHTLRQAVGSLQTEGLLRIEKGRGMFVQHELMNYTLSRRTRFSENLQGQGLLPGRQLLTACEIAAPDHVADELKLDRRTPVLMVENLHVANDEPVNLAKAYYPASRFAGLLALLGEGVSSTDILKRFGVQDYVRVHSRITTQMPSVETSRLLRQPETRPLLCVESVDADLQGVPIKYGETSFCGDRVQLVVAMAEAK